MLLLEILGENVLFILILFLKELGVEMERLGILLVSVLYLIESFPSLTVLFMLQSDILFRVLCVFLFVPLPTELIIVDFILIGIGQLRLLPSSSLVLKLLIPFCILQLLLIVLLE